LSEQDHPAPIRPYRAGKASLVAKRLPTQGARMIRILLVEDHAAFRQGLAFLLGREPDLEVVAQAGSLAEARGVLGGEIDVTVLDLRLPDGDGTELVERLREANPDVSVVVLTAAVGPDRLAEAQEAGADAVLGKVEAPARIVGEIRRLAGSG
jgi:DNA-binding NarL/FixJ family response regulator